MSFVRFMAAYRTLTPLDDSGCRRDSEPVAKASQPDPLLKHPQPLFTGYTNETDLCNMPGWDQHNFEEKLEPPELG